jgi:hypothetical protein
MAVSTFLGAPPHEVEGADIRLGHAVALLRRLEVPMERSLVVHLYAFAICIE